uniref:Uncharacterized protein n=1 Tax=Arundo donax TaxID=35708 RepID=A0A0A9EQX9_ARUDO
MNKLVHESKKKTFIWQKTVARHQSLYEFNLSLAKHYRQDTKSF